MAITARQRKEAEELLAIVKNLTTKWDIEILNIAHEARIEKEKELDNDPNHYRIVIFTA